MVKWIVFAGLLAVYIYILSVLRRANVKTLHFAFKSIGFFLLAIFFVKDYLQMAMNYAITAFVGIFANLIGLFTSANWISINISHSSVFVSNTVDSILLQINTECSGIIETLVFIALIISFDVYTWPEKLMHGVFGTLYLILANALRIIVISFGVYHFGYQYYNLFHSYIGRILFWTLSTMMYFYLFTRPQIKSMRVGDFKYQ